MDVLIAGGGVSGIIAAITAARNGHRVTVLERNRKPLRKLAVSGNGRGNLLNIGKSQYFGDAAFADEILSAVNAEEVRSFWQSIGVSLALEEEGRCYPAGGLASSAVEALLLCAEKLGVQILCNHQVLEISKAGQTFTVSGKQFSYAPDMPRKSGKMKPGELLEESAFSMRGDCVILSCGGAAAPQYGTDGTAYRLAESLGHTCTPLSPALSALLTEVPKVEGLPGQKVRGRFSLMQGNRSLYVSQGEGLFTEDGVSGIAIMALGRHYQPGCTLEMDLRPCIMGMDWDASLHGEQAVFHCEQWLKERAENRRGCSLAEWLVGACSTSVNGALLQKAGLAENVRLARQKPIPSQPSECKKLARAICCFSLQVKGTRGFENAQVTAGGLRCDEFDFQTLQSHFCSGLYVTGEMLNVDGACGGFNILFAAACGLLAGRIRNEKNYRREHL